MRLDLRLDIPLSLREEHEDFHARLERCMHEPGTVGALGREVGRLMHLHCVSEEDFALPPLGLLTRLARGEFTSDMQEVLPLTRRLKAEMPRLFAEHARIEAALQKLRLAARDAHLPEYEMMAVAMIQHARCEEEVLYPAAVVVGDLVAAHLMRAA